LYKDIPLHPIEQSHYLEIQNHFDLRSQVSACANNLGTGWFPDEEKSVVDYLNNAHYKFKQ
jgi:uncharacterized membrane protein